MSYNLNRGVSRKQIPISNRIENNRFLDNSPENGTVIDIQGGTESIIIRNNQFQETRQGRERHAIKQGSDTKNILLENNQIKGLQP